jgi:chromosome segregation ATPase
MIKPLLLLLLILSGTARKPVNTDFLNLISTSTAVKTTENAIKAVLQLLNDLKNANEEAKRKAERFFTDYEGKILEDLNTFTLILNQNTETVDKNQEDLDAVADKIQQTTDYLDWNEKRRSSNNVKLEVLAEQVQSLTHIALRSQLSLHRYVARVQVGP